MSYNKYYFSEKASLVYKLKFYICYYITIVKVSNKNI